MGYSPLALQSTMVLCLQTKELLDLTLKASQTQSFLPYFLSCAPCMHLWSPEEFSLACGASPLLVSLLLTCASPLPIPPPKSWPHVGFHPSKSRVKCHFFHEAFLPNLPPRTTHLSSHLFFLGLVFNMCLLLGS